MKKLNFFVLALFVFGLFAFNAFAQDSNKPKNPKFDKKLAQRLGANKNGMKQYVFATLKRGTKKFDDAERATLLKGHMDFINRTAKEGKLVLAGPFGDDKDIRGIYIFNFQTVEEAQKMIENDPSIKAGLFEVELRPWYGTAALMEVLRIHEMITEEEM